MKRIKQTLAKYTLRFFGWKVTGHHPVLPKGIFVVVPHTHWLDFPLGLLARARLAIDIKFLAKKSLFSGWKGFLFRWLGGYPVERSRDRKSTRLNSSHVAISYAVFCLK